MPGSWRQPSEIDLQDGERFPLAERKGKYFRHQFSSHCLLTPCFFTTYYVPGFMLTVGITNWIEQRPKVRGKSYARRAQGTTGK